jgi:hypothetical protein
MSYHLVPPRSSAAPKRTTKPSTPIARAKWPAYFSLYPNHTHHGTHLSPARNVGRDRHLVPPPSRAAPKRMARPCRPARFSLDQNVNQSGPLVTRPSRSLPKFLPYRGPPVFASLRRGKPVRFRIQFLSRSFSTINPLITNPI